MDDAWATAIRVETVELDASGSRQIASRRRTSSPLVERRQEIEQGIRAAVEVVRSSLSASDGEDSKGWRVSSVEATFGITLAAEAGVVLSKASAEATFEVTLTVERV
ncbi:CU044_2847 family protein [Saccharothrix deserti]|uniref:CU044_2847 family protein n=1 Tax=Saccharothrix deserti TaxID=2593674 RepID=UPI00131AA0BA|nr:CU044_2847 family protein [Saccharothrix deserti]